MNKVKTMCKAAILPTIVAALIFFLNYFCFGIENTMIAPFATLSFLRFRNMANHYACVTKNYLIFLAMTGLAFVASINLPLCILINALALFWLAYLLIDEYNPTNYFPAGMALIFFQMQPAADLFALSTRVVALTASMLIVFVFTAILASRRVSKDPIADNIRQGLAICGSQFDACLTGDHDTLDRLHQELIAINRKIADEIYHYNRSTLRARGRINWYCRYVALFQVINYYTTQVFAVKKEGVTEEYTALRNTFHRFKKQFETTTPGRDFKQLHFRNNKPSIQSFRFRFAMRLILVMTPCMAFSYVSGLENSFWLAISVFFMMIPISDYTRQRIRQRIIGTCCGIALCFVLFTIFQSFPARVVIMMLANFMIYASTSYAIMVTYITCSALAIQSMDDQVSILLLQRIFYTLAGALIAFIANMFVFQIRTRKEMIILIQRLDDVRNDMLKVTEETYPDPDERQHYTDERIIKSYLLMKRLQTYASTLSDRDRDADGTIASFAAYEKQYMEFMAAYLKENLLEKMPL